MGTATGVASASTWRRCVSASATPSPLLSKPVKQLQFGGGRLIDRFGSAGASVHAVSRRVLQVVVIPIEPGGRVGRHPASALQVFAVSSGSGSVSGGDGECESIVAGEAVVWDVGEEHESGSGEGMTAIVVEAEELDVWRSESDRKCPLMSGAPRLPLQS